MSHPSWKNTKARLMYAASLGKPVAGLYTCVYTFLCECLHTMLSICLHTFLRNDFPHTYAHVVSLRNGRETQQVAARLFPAPPAMQATPIHTAAGTMSRAVASAMTTAGGWATPGVAATHLRSSRFLAERTRHGGVAVLPVAAATIQLATISNRFPTRSAAARALRHQVLIAR